MCCSQSWTTIGAVLGGLAVVFGAFAAHGLDGYFVRKYEGETRVVVGTTVSAAEKYLEDFKTGARYQMYHALALVAVGLLSQAQPKRSLQLAAWAFLLGIVLFSGSLYVLTTTGQRWLGMVAAAGGLSFIVGWIALAVATCPCSGPKKPTP